MNCKEAKNIDITSFLAEKGVKPAKVYGNYMMYYSLFRNERTPSLKVDIKKNLWNDFGAGIGGTIIDLVMHLNSCSAKEAIIILTNNNFSFHQKTNEVESDTLSRILVVKEIENKYLLHYLKERRIKESVAKKYCSELHYTFNGKKIFYGIGFANNFGGYEIRNKYFKGCIGAKTLTTIQNGSNTLNLFEGFIDFLSYIILKPLAEKEDFLILNSTSNIKKAFKLIANYPLVKTFFDNDSSGRNATKSIRDNVKYSFVDSSVLYSKHKDLNEFLNAK